MPNNALKIKNNGNASIAPISAKSNCRRVNFHTIGTLISDISLGISIGSIIITPLFRENNRYF